MVHTWNVKIHLFDADEVRSDDEITTAHAVLTTSAGTTLEGYGRARRNPEDRDIPEIGDELAVSRALMGLAQDLFEATVVDVEQNTGTKAGLTL